MAITLYSGTPGSGKSLHAAREILLYLKAGKNIIANFDMNFERVKRKKHYGHYYLLENEDLTVGNLVEFAQELHKPRKESQTIIVIDECADMFNCRDWNRNDRAEWMKFLCQHRKLGYDIILISQHDRMLDKQVRALVETEVKHRALKNYNLFGYVFSKLCGGVFVAVQYWYCAKTRICATWFRYHRRYDEMYDTYKIFS